MDRAESAESNRNRASIFERFAGLTHDATSSITFNPFKSSLAGTLTICISTLQTA